MRFYKCCCKILIRFILFFVFVLCIFYIYNVREEMCDHSVVDPDHIKRAHTFAKNVLQAKCQPAYARTEMDRLFPGKYNMGLRSFVKKNKYLNESLYQYGPPFGFRQHLKELNDTLDMLSEDDLPKDLRHKECKRCIVMGSGAVLHGLELGHIVDQFDIVIRLNSAPVHGYEQHVGNKTTIRMTYPEGTPASEQEYFSNSLFVTVLFKRMDFLWLQAMLKNEKLSAWNKWFFWKSVADKVPLKSHQFRILNPLIVKETALDILQFLPPQEKWWIFQKNVPTIGAVAMILATHLCDEVSIAGFGYDLSHPYVPLHYFGKLCMHVMIKEIIHDVNKERKLLQMLVQKGVLKDLSGGIHCAFCPVNQTGKALHV